MQQLPLPPPSFKPLKGTNIHGLMFWNALPDTSKAVETCRPLVVLHCRHSDSDLVCPQVNHIPTRSPLNFFTFLSANTKTKCLSRWCREATKGIEGQINESFVKIMEMTDLISFNCSFSFSFFRDPVRNSIDDALSISTALKYLFKGSSRTLVVLNITPRCPRRS